MMKPVSDVLVRGIKQKRKIDEVFYLITKYGNSSYIGEPVTVAQHLLQSGNLARKRGYPNFVRIGALFHDIGQILPLAPKGYLTGVGLSNMKDMITPEGKNLGTTHHEYWGSQYLATLGFDDRVCTLVSRHVMAKRYRISTDVHYFSKLSMASQETLYFQGGVMSAEEVEHFSQNPLCDWILKVREVDDAAKEETPPITEEDIRLQLESFLPDCEELLK